jgi:DNA-binding NarL/FixJ family response regulator
MSDVYAGSLKQRATVASWQEGDVLNVLIIDDHNLFRSGLRLLLSDLDEGIGFLESEGVEQATQYFGQHVQIVLLDMNLRGVSGLDALREVRRGLPDATIVALSSEEDLSLVRDVIEAGAAGYIPKSSTPEVLIQALKLILAGGTYLPEMVLTDRLNSQPAATAQNPGGSAAAIHTGMSPRQTDALLLAVQGKSNKVIARELNIAEGTVKLHLSAAYRALGVTNRTEAVFAAADLGIVPQERM